MTDEITTKRRAFLRSVFDGLNGLMEMADAQKDIPLGISIENARETLRDAYPDDVYEVDCEGCGKVILAGEHGHVCVEGETLCEECAFTWGEVKEQIDSGEHGGDDNQKAEFLASYEKHIAAGGSPDDKMLRTL